MKEEVRALNDALENLESLTGNYSLISLVTNRGLLCMSMRDRGLDKEHAPLTATVVHSHGNQIVHFERLLGIKMVAGKTFVVQNKQRSGDLKWRLMSWFPFKDRKVWHRIA